MEESPDRILREREAARLLGVSHRTLQRWRYEGGGPRFVRCGLRAVGYQWKVIIDWIDSRGRGSTSERDDDQS